jgi:hypothetical protein
VWRALKSWGQSGLDIIAERVKLTGPTGSFSSATGGWNWFGLSRLNPRERILYYYLNILKRADKRRLTRRKFETPYEYEPNLGHAVPEVEPDVRDLTDVFVRARYSEEGFDETQAESVKEEWQRIRKELRKVRRSGNRDEKSDKSG